MGVNYRHLNSCQEKPGRGMPKQTYNLPRLTAFATRVTDGNLGLGEKSQASPPLRFDEAEVVRTEPAVPSVDTVSDMQEERSWSDGLCDCSNDMSHCALTAFFPCCMACHEYKIQGDGCGTPLCFGLSLLPLTVKYRTKHNIRGSLVKDCLLSLFCYQCQLCRLHRDFMKGETEESNNRGS
ncbi:hypothetical protein Aperf_G00000005686 [Anoplocephala perfoliata]